VLIMCGSGRIIYSVRSAGYRRASRASCCVWNGEGAVRQVMGNLHFLSAHGIA
jgi:hypothetical protein